jgi:DNA-directed RNA polymerase specialized sigma24 family protein
MSSTWIEYVGGDAPRTPPPDATVAEIVRQAASGDRHAWNELADRYGGVVLEVARAHRLGDIAVAEVAQLTWNRAAEHVAGMEHPERFGAWLTSVACEESMRVAGGASQPQREQILRSLLQREPAPSAKAAGACTLEMLDRQFPRTRPADFA